MTFNERTLLVLMLLMFTGSHKVSASSILTAA